ncbi:MAG TPA: cytochrome P450 [Bryobacteraceae bacterium]|jgi:cytochrome P450|nr:cytochrome P450 [Bryobacteraceae bacterium]
MLDLFSDEVRRNPYPLYDELRASSPLLRVPSPFDAWMVFDYENVKRVLTDNETFSSRVPAPRNWFIFFDPPAHTKLRALISRAFSPRMITNLDSQVRELSRDLLNKTEGSREIDLAAQYSVPLPMMVIAGMIGIESADWPRYRRWSDVILRLSYSRSGGEEASVALREFSSVNAEMSDYLQSLMARRRGSKQEDLLTSLAEAEIDGERLSHDEILGFFQLLIVAGQETTSDLINNLVLCLLENPIRLARLRVSPDLIPSAVEEALRFCSPLQWMMRTPRHDVEIHGTLVPAGALLLPVIGSANRDPRRFHNPHHFEIARRPNPHLAFGHGIHFCLGAALSRMEARVALTDLLTRFKSFELATDAPWQPRKALQVYGPASLPLRVETSTGGQRRAASRG